MIHDPGQEIGFFYKYNNASFSLNGFSIKLQGLLILTLDVMYCIERNSHVVVKEIYEGAK